MGPGSAVGTGATWLACGARRRTSGAGAGAAARAGLRDPAGAALGNRTRSGLDEPGERRPLCSHSCPWRRGAGGRAHSRLPPALRGNLRLLAAAQRARCAWLGPLLASLPCVWAERGARPGWPGRRDPGQRPPPPSPRRHGSPRISFCPAGLCSERAVGVNLLGESLESSLFGGRSGRELGPRRARTVSNLRPSLRSKGNLLQVSGDPGDAGRALRFGLMSPLVWGESGASLRSVPSVVAQPPERGHARPAT